LSESLHGLVRETQVGGTEKRPRHEVLQSGTHR
jgi:hypothetical protein